MVDSGRSFSKSLQANNFSGNQVRVLVPRPAGGNQNDPDLFCFLHRVELLFNLFIYLRGVSGNPGLVVWIWI